ncbi:unnamed protein product [Rotaria sp. Silwood1]|nr:unnamed protein product [Rotaria sp. Silwood1]
MLASQCTSEWVALPPQPILFGFFQFIYLTNRSIDEFKRNILPDFVCFDSERCPGLLQFIVVSNFNNGLTCCHRDDLPDEISNKEVTSFYQIENVFQSLVQRCLTIGREYSCSDSSLFYCSKSMKCISYHRLVDGIQDCFFGEDESYSACSLNNSNRFICASDSAKCLSLVAVGNGIQDCPFGEDDPYIYMAAEYTQVTYSKFCDGSLYGPYINNDYVDEMYCEYWPCNTPYTRCDGYWSCMNGIDELNCPFNSCPLNHHACHSYWLENFICLPFEHLYDEISNNCSFDGTPLKRHVYFDNETKTNKNDMLAWYSNTCITLDKLCHSTFLQSNNSEETLLTCYYSSYHSSPDEITKYNGEYLCDQFWSNPGEYQGQVFSTSYLGFIPPTLTIPVIKPTVTINLEVPKTYHIDITLNQYCHRGIFLRFGSNEEKKCLCPPSSFGDRCQWQSQRVSLTLQLNFRSVTRKRAVFQVIVMLIDEDGHIAPNIEQLTFVPARDCGMKYNLYLLYPDRPKDSSKNYSVHIDVFDRLTLNHHVSWHLSIPYSFLPVNRLVARLTIPDQIQFEDCSLDCGSHGQCRRYDNKKMLFYCQCDSGYSGLNCNQSHQCSCTNDARCLASTHCLCPLHRFGRYCFLEHIACQLNKSPCQNQGLCVPGDTRWTLKEFICLCRDGYTGSTCENITNRIEIKLEHHLLETISSLAIHLITMFTSKKHERVTLFKKIPINQDTITVHIENPFHIVLAELFNHTYYRLILREVFIPSESIHVSLKSNQRCPSINELGNETWSKLPLWHRGKYYPLLCRQNSLLACFYDDTLICICDSYRFANCFEFNHSMIYNCQNSNICENNGQCHVNNETCPTMLICTCPACFYGTKCQLSTRGFILSLESILGYHIKPYVSFRQQSISVKVTIAINAVTFIISIISNLLSIMTFRMKETRKVGCGLYILTSSIISLCIILLLTIKIWYLLLSQMAFIHNRILLKFFCVFTDGTLRILSASYDWLNACVSIERLLTVRKGAIFNKEKSRKISKRVIFIILLLTTLTHLHDPLHRRLTDDFDIDEKRTWCFVQYSSLLDQFNSAIVFLHILMPLSINMIAVIIMIVLIVHARSNVQPHKSIYVHFRQQLNHHKNVLITSSLLVLLSLPRLIIPFFTKCMKTPRSPFLFLIGYFISYIPTMLTFLIFVLPSKTYIGSFRKAMNMTKCCRR